MQKLSSILSVVLIAVMVTGCYHAKITTDKESSGQVIEQPWASSFIFGLVPPAEVKTAEECPGGVAKVETKISFLNGLVSGITFNLYTPMHIKVTCAAQSSAGVSQNDGNQMTVAKNASEEQVLSTIDKAAHQAVITDNPVAVQFK